MGQDRASRPRSLPVTSGIWIVLAAAAVAITLIPAAAAGAPAVRGCDRPAGSPEEAAVLQYCPRESPQERERANRAVPAVGAGEDGSASPAARERSPDVDTSTLPLLDYPASDGVSVIFWILIAIAALIAARELYRRYLAERIGARRAAQGRTGGV
ncbi:MAG: hypothetical protein ACRDKH_08585 [Solirubrobacterales bacterium]